MITFELTLHSRRSVKCQGWRFLFKILFGGSGVCDRTRTVACVCSLDLQFIEEGVQRKKAASALFYTWIQELYKNLETIRSSFSFNSASFSESRQPLANLFSPPLYPDCLARKAFRMTACLQTTEAMVRVQRTSGLRRSLPFDTSAVTPLYFSYLFYSIFHPRLDHLGTAFYRSKSAWS